MSAVERLPAAIDKLETLRGNSGRPWTLEGGGEWIFPIGVTVAPDDGGVTPRQADLIVTLHRTIDAQLAFLRDDYESCKRHGWIPNRYVLTLADAILGGDS